MGVQYSKILQIYKLLWVTSFQDIDIQKKINSIVIFFLSLLLFNNTGNYNCYFYNQLQSSKRWRRLFYNIIIMYMMPRTEINLVFIESLIITMFSIKNNFRLDYFLFQLSLQAIFTKYYFWPFFQIIKNSFFYIFFESASFVFSYI